MKTGARSYAYTPKPIESLNIISVNGSEGISERGFLILSIVNLYASPKEGATVTNLTVIYCPEIESSSTSLT